MKHESLHVQAKLPLHTTKTSLYISMDSVDRH